MVADFWLLLGIQSAEELPGRLADEERADPVKGRSPLHDALELACQLPELVPLVPEIATVAARVYQRHHALVAAAAARPRRKADQDLLRTLGVDWRHNSEVDAMVQRAERRAGATAELARVAGSGEAPGLFGDPAELRRRYGQGTRIAEAARPPLLEALRSGRTAEARQMVEEIERALLELSRAPRPARPVSDENIEIATRLVRAHDELGEFNDKGDLKLSFDPLFGIPGLGARDLERAGINRLSGDSADRLLAEREPSLYAPQMPRAHDARSFDLIAREILRVPERFKHQESADFSEGEVVMVPLASPEAFMALRDRYADHPAFAGVGITSTAAPSKARLAVGLRLVFQREDGGRREVWGVLDRAHSNARTPTGRARACRIDELGLEQADISVVRHRDMSAVRTPYRSDRWAPAAAPARLGVDEVFMTRPSCAHRSGTWAPTADGDALRLSCKDCTRESLAVVPRHRLPTAGGLSRLGPLEESRYLARQRFHAILQGGVESAASFEQMRTRDGLASLDPADYAIGSASGHRGAARAGDLRAAFRSPRG